MSRNNILKLIIIGLLHFQISFAQEKLDIVSPEPYSVICSDSPLIIKFSDNVENVRISLAEYQFGESKLLTNSFSGNEFTLIIDDPYWYDIDLNIIVDNGELSDQIARVDNIRIATTPKITSQTESAIVCKGEPIVLKIDADGSGLKYQWYRDGKLIPGANKTALIFENAEYELNGTYQCVVSSDYSCQSVMSSPISVFVSTKTQFTVAPLSKQWTYKATAEFKVGIHSLDLEEAGNTKFRWYRDTLNVFTRVPEIIALKDGGRISGAWSDHLIIKDMVYSDRGTYFCIAEGRCGKDTIYTSIGDGFYMKIHNIGFDYDDCEGGTAYLEVEVETLVDAKLEYQWYNTGLRLVKESEKFVGTKTKRLQINDVQNKDAIAYYCRVTMPEFDISQNSQLFTIDPAFLPFITRQPEDFVVLDRANFYAGQVELRTYIYSNRLCKFEWFQDDSSVKSEYHMSASNYDLGERGFPRMAVPSDVGKYYCVITHPCTTLVTNTVNVYWGNEDVIYCTFDKGVLEFEKANDGEENYNYIWHKDKKSLVPNFRIKGNGTHKLDFTWVIVDDTGSYEAWRQHKESGELEYLGLIYLEVKGSPEVRKQFPPTIVNQDNYLPHKNCAVYSHGPILYAQLYFEDEPLGKVEERKITGYLEKFHAFYIGGYNTNLKSGIYKYKFWNECGEIWSEPFEIINTNYKPSGEVKSGGDDDYVSSVSDLTIPQMFIYPNPARDLLTVHCAHFVPRTIIIRNLVGEEIYRAELETDASSVPINLADKKLPSGMYFIHVTDGLNFLVEKIILQ
ncbi:MAG: T9SS type A sorting domain-containing protein [Candidatus Kapabacteria bacterium]|nr:T9SS type A sorting domain-containing protein [Candidatus Kapabacteria bacterium]